MLPTERGRELDAAVAVEAMGWTKASDLFWRNREGSYRWNAETMFSCDFNHARTVEAEIERLGLVGRFLLELAEILNLTDTKNKYEQHWRILRATPEQRCIAALAAVRGAKGAAK